VSGDGKRRVDHMREHFRTLAATSAAEAALETREADAAADRAAVLGLPALGGSVFLVMLYAFYLAHSIARPMRRVAEAADALAGGHLDTRTPEGGPGEVGQLARSFNAMADSLQQSRAQADDERTRFEGVLQAATEYSIIASDLDGVTTVFNAGAERMLGYSANEVVGKPAAPQFHDPDEVAARAAELGVEPGLDVFVTTAKHGEPETREWTYIRKDGTRLPVLLTVTPVRSADGETVGFMGIANDLSERKRSEEAAEQAHAEAVAARAEAERANQAKSEFLSRMSHELRTPLNAILGFGQLLEMDGLEPGQQESVHHIMRGGRHLLDLINEILDISRIEAGTLAISLEPVRVGDALADVLSLVRPLAEERSVTLRHELTALDDVHVLADRQRLKQVLLNLMSNAIKYNRLGGTATVELEDAGAKMRILVRDQGAGIAPEHLERVFLPFDRLGAEQGPVEGTGLGLALSKRLVDVMGGTLTVETTIAAGTTFAVDLAVTDSPEATARAKTPPGARPILDLPTLPPGVILYIEDNVSNLRLAQQVLAGQEHVELISAMKGADGLELAQTRRPDVVLLDLHLPDMGGTDVLERLKADPATRDIAVVVLSADATDGQVKRLMNKGARDYLTKPLDLERFFEVIASILDRRSTRVS
jgi:PAS domain S-box-containing protein